MKRLILAALFLGLVMISENSFSSVVYSPEQVHFRTKAVAWDADTNGKITTSTTNIGVALYITNDSPDIIYLSIPNPSPGMGGFVISLSNNICKNSTTGGRACTSYSDENFLGSIFGLSGTELTLQSFSTYKINLGSYKLSNVKTSLPLDVETTMNYQVYADSKFMRKLFTFSANSDDSVYIP